MSKGKDGELENVLGISGNILYFSPKLLWVLCLQMLGLSPC